MTAEVDELYKRNRFKQILVKYLTASERRKACDAIMLSTYKNNGDVNGRDVFTDKQSYIWTTKDNTDSPSAADEIIMITVAIDAK